MHFATLCQNWFWLWLCLTLILRFCSCSRSASGLSPSGCTIPDHAGKRAFMGSCSGPLLIGWRLPGRSRDGARAPRKCTISQKQYQNRYGLNRENLKKSQKSETNSDLRLFIFCAFCI
nr:MAG TPA: hypothetical protein [Caudoviricetes sp.]